MEAKNTYRKYIDCGFTGLEAAIVLIAFVVVAAVFSYVVLGAGFFTTQKSQEVVHTGIQQASSSMEIIGSVYGHSTTPATGIDFIRFTVGLTSGGSSVDLQKLTMSYLPDGGSLSVLANDASAEVWADVAPGGGTYVCGGGGAHDPLAGTAGAWSIEVINNDNGGQNLVLEPNEQAVLCAVPPAAIAPNTGFTLYMQPIVGASFPIHRTAPAAITTMNTLY